MSLKILPPFRHVSEISPNIQRVRLNNQDYCLRKEIHDQTGLASDIEILSKLVKAPDFPSTYARVFGCYADKTHQYMLCEWVQGPSIRNLLHVYPVFNDRDARLLFVFPLLSQLVDGLAFLHRHRLYHRNIKFDNIRWASVDSVKLVDLELLGMRKRCPVMDRVEMLPFSQPVTLKLSKGQCYDITPHEWQVSDLYGVFTFVLYFLDPELFIVDLYEPENIPQSVFQHMQSVLRSWSVPNAIYEDIINLLLEFMIPVLFTHEYTPQTLRPILCKILPLLK